MIITNMWDLENVNEKFPHFLSCLFFHKHHFTIKGHDRVLNQAGEVEQRLRIRSLPYRENTRATVMPFPSILRKDGGPSS